MLFCFRFSSRFNPLQSKQPNAQQPGEDQRNIRKVSRFCVSRVQEQNKANDNLANKSATSGGVTPPTSNNGTEMSEVGSVNDRNNFINIASEQLVAPALNSQQQQLQQQQPTPTVVAPAILPPNTQLQPTVLNLQQPPQQPQPTVLYNPAPPTNIMQLQQQLLQQQQQQVNPTAISQQKLPTNAQILLPNVHMQQSSPQQQPPIQKLTISPSQQQQQQQQAQLHQPPDGQKQTVQQQPQHPTILTSQQQQTISTHPQNPQAQLPQVLRPLVAQTVTQNSSSYMMQPSSHQQQQQQHMINPIHTQQPQQQPVYMHNESKTKLFKLKLFRFVTLQLFFSQILKILCAYKCLRKNRFL